MPVVLVSKDTNLRIKAEALGIRAQDYENDRIPDVSIFTAKFVSSKCQWKCSVRSRATGRPMQRR
jgi:predicted ribonuclease YlaK